MPTETVIRSTRRVRILRATLRALWFGVIPVVLAAFVLRYLVPSGAATFGDGAIGILARFAAQNPLLVGVGAYLSLAWFVRHWAADLPGGRYLSAPSFEFATEASRECVRVYPRAAELHATLMNPAVRGRMRRRLTASESERLDARLAELVSAFDVGDVRRLAAAELSIRSSARSALAAEERRNTIGLVLLVGAAAAAALLLRSVVVESFRVLGDSMLPTLESGDCVVASRLAYGVRLPQARRIFSTRPPRRGDVVVFPNLHPDGSAPDHLVKRIIGLPGDRISMRGAHPLINGWEVPSCDAGTYVYPRAWGGVRGRLVVEFLDGDAYLTVLTPVTGVFEHYDVQDGEVFVLGDNRNNSSDSRAWNDGHGGGVPITVLDGKVERFVLGEHRDGTVDLSRFFATLGTRLHLEGLDARALEQGVARCLARRPASTTPPVRNSMRAMAFAE